MAEEKTYYIKIQDVVVEVTKTVYHAYYRMERHARHLEEKLSLIHISEPTRP